MTTEHVSDLDCLGHIDAATGCCAICGVDQNVDPCHDCGGQGYHNAGCSQSDEPVCERCGKPLSEMEHAGYAPHCSAACERATINNQWAWFSS